MDMRIAHLRYFVEIVTCASINKASRNLLISQPTLTSAIKAMESELGFALLTRTHHGVKLTEKGKKVFLDAQQIIAMENSWKMMREQEMEATGDVHVAVMPSVSPSCINESIYALKKEYPKINVVLHEGRQKAVLRQLEKKTATIGVIGYLPEETEQICQFVKEQALLLRKLYQDHMVVFIGRDHPITKKKIVTLDDLRDIPVAVHGEQDTITQSFIRYFKQDESYYMNSLHAMMMAVVENNVAAVCSQSYADASPLVKMGFIKILDVEDFYIPLTYCLLYRGSKEINDAEIAVVKIFSEHLIALACRLFQEKES